MPEIKVPPFLSDLYWDLHDRRLLPIVALLVVAIVAVPFLLGGGGSEEAKPAHSGAASSLKREMTDVSELTVVRADPGLREYSKRLARHKPTNPFKQKFTGSNLKGATLNQPPTSTTPTTTTTTVTGGELNGGGSSGTPASTPPSSGNGGGGSPGGTTTTKKPHLTFFTYGINVRITRSGGKDASPNEKPEPSVKHDVLPQTALPGEKAPVVTYLGLARKGKKATGKVLMMVSNEVKSVFGETKCVSGDEVCQLIEVEPGFPVTFVYGANEVKYTINVLKIELVVTGHS